LTDEEGRSIGADCLDFTTIAGLCFNGIYRRYFLPEQTVALVEPAAKQQYSYMCAATMEYLMKEKKIVIQHALRGGEAKLLEGENGRMYPVDGWDEANNTAYQFHGCYYHGCPHCFQQKATVPMRSIEYMSEGKKVVKNVTFGNLYQDTLRKDAKIREHPDVHELVTIWECQAKQWEMKEILEEIRFMKPLNPRDGFFGGRTDCPKLYYKCSDDEWILYYDIVSMYPWVMSNEKNFYPVGEPTILRKGEVDEFPDVWGVLGMVHCRVSPPTDQYFPVLPSRGDQKVLFNCGEEMVGTWTTVELHLALERGYQLLEIFEMHVFEQSSNSLFKSYNDVMFAIKDKAKRENNPGLKMVAKIALNSVFGKWGQNVSRFNHTEVVTTHEDLHRKLFGTFEHVTVDILNEKNALVHTQKHEQMTFHDASNVYLAAFITAYSRKQLFEEALEPIGVNVLYHDTDSVIYVARKGEFLQPEEIRGEKLGMWENEVGTVNMNGENVQDYFTEFVSVAPKSYALRSFSGQNDIVKCKGFGLHYKNAQIMTFDNMKVQAETMAKQTDSHDPDPNVPELCLHKGDPKMTRNMFNINMEKDKGKVLHRGYNKRFIRYPVYNQDRTLKMIDTEPWGYTGLTKQIEGVEDFFQM